MSEEKEMTAPNVSIGADTEQSSIKQTTNSISNRDVNFNPFDEFFKKIDPLYMKTVTMQELYQDIYSKKPPVIEGLLYQGTYLFVGSPKIGKSFFMAQLAYHVSTGIPLWDYPVKKGTVLYLALEDDYRRLQERMYRMFGTETTPNLFFSVASMSLNEGLLDWLDTDALTVTHNTPDAEPSVIAFSSDHIKYHLHYSAEYRPARLKKLVNGGTILSYLTELDRSVAEAIERQVGKMLENDTEYLRAVAVGDLAKARGLENMDRLIARDPVYAAMVYV